MHAAKTNNPRRIIEDYLGLEIAYAPFELQDGIHIEVSNVKIIVINSKHADTTMESFILAHELYHLLDHSDVAELYHLGFNTKGRFERQANEFATKLLAYGYEIQEQTTCYDVMKACGIPDKMEQYLTYKAI